MKKLLSMILSLAMVFSLFTTAFASETPTGYPFSNEIIYAEINDGGIQTFSQNSIIVMAEEQALELDTNLQDITENCELVYITGDINPIVIANAAGLPAPGQATNADDNDTTVKNIAVSLDFENEQFYLEEIAVKSDNLTRLLNSRSSTLTLDGINAALYERSPSEVSTDGAQTYALPIGYDKYSDKSTTVYDNNNKNIGTMRFNARYYNRGSWTFKPVSPISGNALSQEPEIRSVSKSLSDKYTTITLSCPFYNSFGGVLKENYLSWNISW